MTTSDANHWAQYRLTSAYRGSSTCANCFAHLANIVVAVPLDPASDLPAVHLGLDCAQRVGFTAAQLSAMRVELHGPKPQLTDAERASRLAAKAARQAEIDAEAAARSAISVIDWCLCSLDGTPVPHRLVRGRYGLTWVVLPEWGSSAEAITFVSAFPKRVSTMAAKGYVERLAYWPAAGPLHKPWADLNHGPQRLVEPGDAVIEGDVVNLESPTSNPSLTIES